MVTNNKNVIKSKYFANLLTLPTKKKYNYTITRTQTNRMHLHLLVAQNRTFECYTSIDIGCPFTLPPLPFFANKNSASLCL
jgi:hypothetical protein